VTEGFCWVMTRRWERDLITCLNGLITCVSASCPGLVVKAPDPHTTSYGFDSRQVEVHCALARDDGVATFFSIFFRMLVADTWTSM